MTTTRRHRVRVWFGEHVIASFVGDAPLAERYEHAMRRRFAGLRVTNEPLPGGRGQVGDDPVKPYAQGFPA